jgi:hypothetical protein
MAAPAKNDKGAPSPALVVKGAMLSGAREHGTSSEELEW